MNARFDAPKDGWSFRNRSSLRFLLVSVPLAAFGGVLVHWLDPTSPDWVYLAVSGLAGLAAAIVQRRFEVREDPSDAEQLARLNLALSDKDDQKHECADVPFQRGVIRLPARPKRDPHPRSGAVPMASWVR